MMSNLFSVFDPSTSIMNMQMNWLSTIMGLMIMPTTFWMIPSRHSMLWNKIMINLHKEFKSLLASNELMSGSSLMFISMMSLIMFNNFLGLFPYIFTSTSHLLLTLSLALPMWITFMMFGWFKNTKHMFAHMVPQGTPPILMPFMVCIESISNIIRPGTLAVRLAANMIAGHLLLTLLSSTGSMISYPIMLILITTQIALLMLESAVAIIQSYVFAVLTTLYSSEVI